jgi:hypothetical protein
MGNDQGDRILLCPGCLTPAEAPGACEHCGTTVIECRPGEADDPCRRPLMNRNGKVLTRAPIWWLQHRVGSLIDYLDISKERE